METSVFLAQAFSIYLFVVMGALFLNREAFLYHAKAMMEHRGVSYLGAIMTLILGIILVLFHNVWVMDWPVLVTLFCWITFAKGLIRVVYPQADKHFMKMVDNHMTLNIVGLVDVLLAIYLAYHGFVA